MLESVVLLRGFSGWRGRHSQQCNPATCWEVDPVQTVTNRCGFSRQFTVTRPTLTPAHMYRGCSSGIAWGEVSQFDCLSDASLSLPCLFKSKIAAIKHKGHFNPDSPFFITRPGRGGLCKPPRVSKLSVVVLRNKGWWRLVVHLFSLGQHLT